MTIEKHVAKTYEGPCKFRYILQYKTLILHKMISNEIKLWMKQLITIQRKKKFIKTTVSHISTFKYFQYVFFLILA